MEKAFLINTFKEQKFTFVLFLESGGKKLPGNQQGNETGKWGNGQSTNFITSSYHEAPPGGLDDGYCVLQCMNAGIDFSFKGHSVEMCF